MKFKIINKIIWPIYIYFILFGFYYLYMTRLLYKYDSDLLTDILFYSFLIFIPLIILIFTNIRLNKFLNKRNYLLIFLFLSAPGLVSGIWLGYGASAVLFPATVSGFIQALVIGGLLGGLLFGVLGLVFNFFINLIKRN